MAREPRQSWVFQITLQIIITLGTVAVAYFQFAVPKVRQEAKSAGEEAAKPAADKALDERINEVAQLRREIQDLQIRVQGMKVEVSLGNCKSPADSWTAVGLTPKPGEKPICAPGYVVGGVNPQSVEAICCTYGLSKP